MRAMSIQEELEACKRQLKSARENLFSANEKLNGGIYTSDFCHFIFLFINIKRFSNSLFLIIKAAATVMCSLVCS